VRERSPNQRGENRDRSKLKSRYGNRSLTRDPCVVCKQIGHWKKNYLELKKKNKLKEKSEKTSEVNVSKSMLSHSLSHHRYVTQMIQSGYWTPGYLSHMSQDEMVL